MSKSYPYKPQRHPSGRGYEVIDHRDMSVRGHWSSEEAAAAFAATWNLREITQQRDDLLTTMKMARQHIQSCSEYDLDAERRHTNAGMYGSAAECRKQYEMRLSALKVIDAAIAA
jgi:hypothetical protein